MKTCHPSKQRPLSPFTDTGEMEGTVMHFGSQGASASRKGKREQAMEKGMSVFSVNRTRLLRSCDKGDIFRTVFPSKLSLWKIHCVIPLKPNGSVRTYKKAKL